MRKFIAGAAAVGLAFAITAPVLADFAAGVAAYDKEDYQIAYQEWLPLAENGDPAAQRNIGHLFRKGYGVERDPVQAAEWYRRAAELGFARAQANLATMHRQGEGVEQDYDKAAMWYDRAARQGHAISQYNLALMYERGIGVTQSNEKALGWYYKAASQGHKKSVERLGTLVVDLPGPGSTGGVGASAPPDPDKEPRPAAQTPEPVQTPAPQPAPRPAPVETQKAPVTPPATTASPAPARAPALAPTPAPAPPPSEPSAIRTATTSEANPQSTARTEGAEPKVERPVLAWLFGGGTMPASEQAAIPAAKSDQDEETPNEAAAKDEAASGGSPGWLRWIIGGGTRAEPEAQAEAAPKTVPINRPMHHGAEDVWAPDAELPPPDKKAEIEPALTTGHSIAAAPTHVSAPVVAAPAAAAAPLGNVTPRVDPEDLELRARGGDAEAQYRMGLRLQESGGDQELHSAYAWLAMAADSGHAGAMSALRGVASRMDDWQIALAELLMDDLEERR